jgi:hypothetical protein
MIKKKSQPTQPPELNWVAELGKREEKAQESTQSGGSHAH